VQDDAPEIIRESLFPILPSVYERNVRVPTEGDACGSVCTLPEGFLSRAATQRTPVDDIMFCPIGVEKRK
jgi:hypothetical protein